jgi:hypothetical protein
MAKSHYQNLLERKIKEAMDKRGNALVAGECDDYAAYKFEVGYLTGMNDALALAEEIEREME